MDKKTPQPTKLCALCGRQFGYRKKWARDWDKVLYCSDKCRNTRIKTVAKPE